MPKMYITRREVFSASHRLWNPDLTEEQNIQLFDKCASANGHGHNYTLEVTVCGDTDKNSGYAIDFKKLKHVILKEIIEKADHKHLNYDVDFLKGVIPTAENIARAIWNVLESKIEGAKLFSVRLRETENNAVEFKGEE
jgi:6-pyruvoyltetrahydropterin/6-carboxytetrahydropterin synthase